jgi:serine/threonine-protein kinase
VNADPISIDALLESVADGRRIDWDAVEASADDQQRRLVRHLRLVANVAEVHRTIPAGEAQGAAWALDAATTGDAGPKWGHLLLLEKIGEGAFGEVHRARDPWLDREVALKLLRPDASGGLPAVRIVSEARTLARVRHPNVVTVYGADMQDGRAGLWMELVRGRTLAQIVAADGPFSAAEAAVIGQEICRALAAVHAAGLVHRDVKAQNVMREAGGRLVLMDFGAGQTPLYLAPELLRGGEATIAGDIYALGILLYYVVTGRYPVTAASLDELREAHAAGARRRLGDVRPDLPDAFVAAVERALHPDPAQRYATAREMQDALARVTGAGTGRFAPFAARGAGTRVPARPWTWAAAALAAVAVTAGGVSLWRGAPAAPASPDGTTWLAVLPFRPIGSDVQTAYYSEGLSEDLTAQLSRLPAVRLVSGVSVRRYRGTDRPAREIGSELNVGALVTGSVRVVDDRVRIVVELVDTQRSEQLWAGTFDRSLDDVLAIQAEVAQQVARALIGSLTPNAAQHLQRSERDPRAFDLYLRGRYHWNTRTPEGLRQSIDLFRQAIAIDPAAPLAHAGLADALLLAAFYRIEPRAQALAAAEGAIVEAIRLDSGLPQAHAALGSLRLDQYRWSDAESALRRAIQLNPSYASAHHWYALVLAAQRRFDEAEAEIRAARAADPFSSAIGGAAGYIALVARQYDRAIAEYREVLAAAPDDLQVNIGLIEAHLARGAVSDARRALDAAERRTTDKESLSLAAAYVYALARDIPRSRSLLSGAESRLAREPGSPAEIASVHAALGDREAAFKWLERAFEEQDPLLGYMAVDPRFDALRGDSRFAALLTRMGLADR